MVVIVVGGRSGTGKTSEILGMAKYDFYQPVYWAVLEKKDEETLDKNVKGVPNFHYETLISVYPKGHMSLITGISDAYLVDVQNTLDATDRWKNKIVSLDPKDVKTIVIDGISDLRSYAEDEWLLKFNEELKKTKPNAKPRESIGENAINAWSEINDRVRNIVIPLINYATYNRHIVLIMTAQMKDLYEGLNRIGERLDIKNWIDHPVHVIIQLHRDLQPDKTYAFWAECTKLPLWAGEGEPFVEKTMVKNDGLLAILSAKGLIEPRE